MSELKNGDVVQLKSGGPAMTIDNIDKKGIAAFGDKVVSTDQLFAWVSWADKSGKIQKDTIPLTSLKKYTPRRRAVVNRSL